MLTVLLTSLLAAWPQPDAQLVVLPWQPAPTVKKLKVFVDAGHGAPENAGNHGCLCQLEQNHTLAVAKHVAWVLASMGPFEVQLSRQGDERPKYPARIEAAEAFKADVIVSIHSDYRGTPMMWRPFSDEQECSRSDSAPGFAVLWNDGAEKPVVQGRERLGRTLGATLRKAGFVPYTGVDYVDLYRRDEQEPSGWIDVRPDGKNVFFLRASKVPTVIIETHHALDPMEVARWGEIQTIDAFTLALANGLLEFGTKGPAKASVKKP